MSVITSNTECITRALCDMRGWHGDPLACAVGGDGILSQTSPSSGDARIPSVMYRLMTCVHGHRGASVWRAWDAVSAPNDWMRILLNRPIWRLCDEPLVNPPSLTFATRAIRRCIRTHNCDEITWHAMETTPPVQMGEWVSVIQPIVPPHPPPATVRRNDDGKMDVDTAPAVAVSTPVRVRSKRDRPPPMGAFRANDLDDTLGALVDTEPVVIASPSRPITSAPSLAFSETAIYRTLEIILSTCKSSVTKVADTGAAPATSTDGYAGNAKRPQSTRCFSFAFDQLLLCQSGDRPSPANKAMMVCFPPCARGDMCEMMNVNVQFIGTPPAWTPVPWTSIMTPDEYENLIMHGHRPQTSRICIVCLRATIGLMCTAITCLTGVRDIRRGAVPCAIHNSVDPGEYDPAYCHMPDGSNGLLYPIAAMCHSMYELVPVRVSGEKTVWYLNQERMRNTSVRPFSGMFASISRTSSSSSGTFGDRLRDTHASGNSVAIPHKPLSMSRQDF